MERFTKRLTWDAMLLSGALILSYLESVLPISGGIPVPGLRLGLANFAVLFAWYCMGMKDAVIVSVLRVGLQALLFGSATSFGFSFGGAVASLLVLLLFSVTKMHRCFSLIGVSVFSAAAHQIGQILVACILFETLAFVPTYLPWLLFCSAVTGGIVGAVANSVCPRLRRQGYVMERKFL